MTSGSTDADIRVSTDEAVPGKINIWLGSAYLTMTLEQFNELIKAVYIAVNIGKITKSAASA